jgi:hypothetical protein
MFAHVYWMALPACVTSRAWDVPRAMVDPSARVTVFVRDVLVQVPERSRGGDAPHVPVRQTRPEPQAVPSATLPDGPQARTPSVLHAVA